MQIGADTADPRYHQPFVDVDEHRAEPVPHRYVSGGFEGTDARFSFYLPPPDQYRGRFFHNTYPMALTSDIAPFPIQFDVAVGNLAFTIDSGAAYVQTNNGGRDRFEIRDAAIGAYRVNAAAAKHFRKLARDYYGDHRSYGYLFGGSGGSYQVMGAAENTRGVWDGFLPYVLGTPYAIPSLFSVRMHALRVLRERGKWSDVIDATNPGGSGDPYAALNAEEAAALREATLMGFPPRGWWNHDTLTSGYLPFNLASVRAMDPTYASDFWSKPGYLGADAASGIGKARVQFETTIAEVLDDGPDRRIRLAEVPDRDFADADLVVLSGTAQGSSFVLAARSGNPIGFSVATDPGATIGLKAGDRVLIDNSWMLALQTYQRHCIPPSTDLIAWNQFRDETGRPLYPQRPVLVGPAAAAGAAGALPDGRIGGKMLAIEALMDIDALPWQADWYASRVKQHLGDDFADNFAIWFIDHAQHDDPQSVRAHAHTVSFAGALQQGLRDLADWVERGKRPCSTAYEVVDAQVRLPAGASERMGPQPAVSLAVSGRESAEVRTGDPVKFTVQAEVPPNAGKVVAVEWDLSGTGDFPLVEGLRNLPRKYVGEAIYAFSLPGTYFPVVRVTSQREGNGDTAFGRISNIARVRVTVT